MFENESEDTIFYLTEPVSNLTDEQKVRARIVGRIAFENRKSLIRDGESTFGNVGDMYTLAKLEKFLIDLYNAVQNNIITGELATIITNTMNGTMDFIGHIQKRQQLRLEIQAIHERELEINRHV